MAADNNSSGQLCEHRQGNSKSIGPSLTSIIHNQVIMCFNKLTLVDSFQESMLQERLKLAFAMIFDDLKMLDYSI